MKSARGPGRHWQAVLAVVGFGVDLALLPHYPVVAGTVEAAALALGLWRMRRLRRTYRSARAEGLTRWDSTAASLGLLPPLARALVMMDLGSWWAFGRLLGRRHRGGPDRFVLSYGLAERLLCSVLVPLSAVEVVVTGYFLHRTPVWPDWDLAGLAGTWFLLGLGLQNKAFPHELTREQLRIRHGALTRLDLPVQQIESVSWAALGFCAEELAREGSLAVTTKEGVNLRLRLRGPWHPGQSGDPAVRVAGDGSVTTAYLSVDDPRRAAELIRSLLERDQPMTSPPSAGSASIHYWSPQIGAA
ncbi:MAG TPA: hypothetical protein VE990_07975 [Acidimicrobiales bacterium]|nr:hypothetical protein [Acidimicrobiales bacterium]